MSACSAAIRLHGTKLRMQCQVFLLEFHVLHSQAVAIILNALVIADCIREFTDQASQIGLGSACGWARWCWPLRSHRRGSTTSNILRGFRGLGAFGGLGGLRSFVWGIWSLGFDRLFGCLGCPRWRWARRGWWRWFGASFRRGCLLGWWLGRPCKASDS